jgi:Chaperone of endosialidase
MDVNSRDPLQNIIPFRIKGVEISRFDSSGNLKIGTTTTTAPTVRLDVSGGAARVNSGSITTTALTTTGRIGVNTTTPTTALDVVGALTVTSGINLTGGEFTVAAGDWQTSSGNSRTIQRLQYDNANGHTYFNTFADYYWRGGTVNNSSSVNNMALFPDARGLWVKDRLGIGITLGNQPTEELDVSGIIQCHLLRTNNISCVIDGNLQISTNTRTVTNTAVGAIQLATQNTVRLHVDQSGKVGIGTQSPTALLHVNGSTLVGALTATSGFDLSGGRMALPFDTWHISGDGQQRLYYQNAAGTLFKSNYYHWRDTSDGYIMGLSEQTYNSNVPQLKAILDIQGRLTVRERLIVNSSDTENNRIGIGMDSPEAPLHVGISSPVAMDPSVAFYSYSADTSVWTPRWTGGGIYSLSIITQGDIWIKGNYIWVSSDNRIKKNIRDINRNTALSQLRKIRPKIYNYIDITKGNQDIYGFIAQDIEDVITNASMKATDYVPNFYCKGDIYTIDASNHIYEITSENELKYEKVIDTDGNEITNYKIKLYDDTNKPYICELLHRNDAKTIRVKCDKEYIFSTVEEYKNKVFIYGQEVHDFHNLDKNAIFTVATAALQEVDRQQQADKARITELEASVAGLETTVAAQQSLINDILERLKACRM